MQRNRTLNHCAESLLLVTDISDLGGQTYILQVDDGIGDHV
jgi:hypothetical protein